LPCLARFLLESFDGGSVLFEFRSQSVYLGIDFFARSGRKTQDGPLGPDPLQDRPGVRALLRHGAFSLE
jgi:hypothetical protein